MAHPKIHRTFYKMQQNGSSFTARTTTAISAATARACPTWGAKITFAGVVAAGVLTATMGANNFIPL